MDDIEFNIKAWLALAPGVNNRKDWQTWLDKNKRWPTTTESVADNLIPPMMRRRMSRLSKIAVQTALQLSQEAQIDYIVFSSRHAELSRTVALLEDIIKGEDASPMAFSQSVHNTAAGLFTIASHCTAPVTSITASDNSLTSAIIEAYCYLAENPQHTVLLVDFDEMLPALYQQYETQQYPSYAFAMLLQSGRDVSISYQQNQQNQREEYPQAFNVIDFLLTMRNMEIKSNHKKWIWTKQL
ncbi:beta-ketoacyl synthase chain length factor [Psychromonas sp. MME2]|uniref:beta-ketoacyl synthase chain length factor n=2 Tax=unclassified Psychromonas TaxID=2614957 RepID=UPI00339BC693